MIDCPLVHVVTSLDEATAGPTYSVARLASSMAEAGAAVHIETLGIPAIELSPKVVVHSHAAWKAGGHLRPAPSLHQSIKHWGADRVILHNHGLWLMPNAYAAWAARRSTVKLVVSPRGMLSAWALQHHRLRKSVAWWLLGQRQLMQRATAFHATADAEAEDIRRLGFRQPIHVIPNGIDIPPEPPETATNEDQRTVLFLSRIHPKKGIDLLLKAWSALEARRPDWQLLIAGPDEGGHLNAMRELSQRLGLKRVSFPGPLRGSAKSRAFHDADLFVLPTHSENFGLVIAEALAHGTPVIATTGTPWRGLIEKGCGWWVPPDIAALRDALDGAMSCSGQELRIMGMKGRAWMQQSYGWEKVSAAYRALYESLCFTMPTQDFVHGSVPDCA